jgi:hypothetical protein
MELLKSVTGKVVSGAVALTVVAAGISWWRMDEATRQVLLSGTGKIVSWLGVVLVLPWVTFFVIGRVAKLENNMAGAALVLAYTIIETALLGWLFGWSLPGPTAWTFFAVAALFAGAYNLFTCDWIAEKVV